MVYKKRGKAAGHEEHDHNHHADGYDYLGPEHEAEDYERGGGEDDGGCFHAVFLRLLTYFESHEWSALLQIEEMLTILSRRALSSKMSTS